MSKHTPGPWKYEKCPCGDPICTRFCIAHSGAEGMFDEADARLIAAAPNMLEALEAIEAALRKDARDKSIAKDTVEYHLDGQTMYHAINTARAAISKATLPPPPETQT